MIDDGGHHVRDQLATFAAMFERGLSPGGIYAIEDIETSYWEDGTPLYGRPTKGPAGCDGKGSGRSTVDTFLSIVHAPVNGKFTDRVARVTGPADFWVKSVTFSLNLIVLTKKSDRDCVQVGPYIWPEKLSRTCPASRQRGPPDPADDPFWRWCQRHGGEGAGRPSGASTGTEHIFRAEIQELRRRNGALQAELTAARGARGRGRASGPAEGR